MAKGKNYYHIQGFKYDERADVTDIKTDITALKGTGYTNETIKGNADNIATKIDKVAAAVENNIATFDDGGEVKDSAKDISTDGTLGDNSDNSVPTEKAVKTYADTKVANSLNTAESDFLVGSPSPFGAWIKKTLAETKTILNKILTETAEAVGFTIAGGTTSKTLTVSEDVTLDQDLQTTSSPSFAEVETDRTATPVVEFKDSDCADDDVNASIEVNATDTVGGQEDVDVYFKHQVDGSLTPYLHVDADGDLDFYGGNIKTFGALKDGTYTTYIKDIRSSVHEEDTVTGDTTLTDVVPAGCILDCIVFNETAGNAPTLDLGTSAGGNEVFSEQLLNASGLTLISINKIFSISAATTLYLNDDQAGSSWNSGSVDVYLIMRRII